MAEANTLETLIAKHDAAPNRNARARVAYVLYNKFGITKYFADHGDHMMNVQYIKEI
jgi:hypothetical protein